MQVLSANFSTFFVSGISFGPTGLQSLLKGVSKNLSFEYVVLDLSDSYLSTELFLCIISENLKFNHIQPFNLLASLDFWHPSLNLHNPREFV